MTDDRLMVRLGALAAIVFIAFCAFLAWRDHRAVERCEALGGVTYDSGQHCILGYTKIVNSRGGVWGQ